MTTVVPPRPLGPDEPWLEALTAVTYLAKVLHQSEA